MVKITVNKGETHVEEFGYGIDILSESLVAVKAMHDAIKKKSDMAAVIFEAMVKSMDFDDNNSISEEDEVQSIFEKMELMTERRLQDEE